MRLMDDYSEIQITSDCTFNCRFCSTKNLNVYMSLSEIKEKISQAHKNRLVPLITGGEPSLHPDFLLLLDYLKETNILSVIETNGIFLLNEKLFTYFLKTFKQNKSVILDILVNGFNSDLHDYLTSVNGSYFALYNVLKLLLKNEIPFYSHVVINKVNYRYLVDIVKFLLKFRPQQIRFIFVLPKGNAATYFDEIIPFISMIKPYLYDILKILLYTPTKIYFENMPYCVIPYFEKYIQRWDLSMNLKKIENCKNCAFEIICPGIYEWYLKTKADDEFIAIAPNNHKISSRYRLAQDIYPYLDNWFFIEKNFDPMKRPL